MFIISFLSSEGHDPVCYGRARYSLTPTAPRRMRVTPATLMRAQGRRGLPRRPRQAADGGTRAIVRIDAIDVDHYLQLEGHVRLQRRNGRCHCCKHDIYTRTQHMRMRARRDFLARFPRSRNVSLYVFTSLFTHEGPRGRRFSWRGAPRRCPPAPRMRRHSRAARRDPPTRGEFPPTCRK